MKKIVGLILLSCYSFISSAQKQFVVDPNAEMRTVNGSYHTIVVSGGIDIYLSQSDKEELAVSATDDKIKAGIKTVIENSILRIYYEGDKVWSNKNKAMKAYVSFAQLQKLEASGASDIVIAGEIKLPSLFIKLTGASDLKGRVTVNSLTMDLSGASDMRISGTATEVVIECSGASDVKGYDLISDICTAKASGASDINITVNKELNANASGASDIYFKGTGVIKSNQVSGVSNISRKK